MSELTDDDRRAARDAWDVELGKCRRDCAPWDFAQERLVSAVFAAGLRAGRQRQREEDARICERRAEHRFDENGTREPDTGATYYGGRIGEEYAARDEEDDDCAAAIRGQPLPPSPPKDE